jgi:hypothetical protein
VWINPLHHKISKYISREKKLQLLQCGERNRAGTWGHF